MHLHLVHLVLNDSRRVNALPVAERDADWLVGGIYQQQVSQAPKVVADDINRDACVQRQREVRQDLAHVRLIVREIDGRRLHEHHP